MRDGYDIRREEMVPFFSIASKDFEEDLVVLKKYYTNLNNKHIPKTDTYLAKEPRWQQDGGSMISWLGQTLLKRSFNLHCHLDFLLKIKELLQ
jgi:hypothetical protein